MTKDQIPTKKRKPFQYCKLLDIVQSPNGNLFIKIDATHAIPLGAFETLGNMLPEDEVKRGISYVTFNEAHEIYTKVGKLKFKEKFLEYIKE